MHRPLLLVNPVTLPSTHTCTDLCYWSTQAICYTHISAQTWALSLTLYHLLQYTSTDLGYFSTQSNSPFSYTCTDLCCWWTQSISHLHIPAQTWTLGQHSQSAILIYQHRHGQIALFHKWTLTTLTLAIVILSSFRKPQKIGEECLSMWD